MFSIFNFEILNLLISVIALIASFYSIWYTLQRDKVSLEIESTTYFTDKYNPVRIHFSILNCSSTPVKITQLELLNLDNSPVQIIYNHKFKVPKQPAIDSIFGIPRPLSVEHILCIPYDSEELVFSNPEIIFPNTSSDFRYYIDSFANQIKIRVTADRPINRWSKTKVFLVHFSNSEK